MRDIYGNVVKTDIFGRKRSNKEIKREVLEENRRRGKSAEETYKLQVMMRGVEIERSPHGRDFIERKRDVWTGKVSKTTHVEVKSSRTAPLSKLQKKVKKKLGSRYRVERPGIGFF